MKLLRVFMVVALMVVPLFASDALADFTAGHYDVDFARIWAGTTNQPIIGFTIPCAGGGKASPDTLRTLALKSYIERSFSISSIKLWVESNHNDGWQSGDTHLKTVSLNNVAFQTQDTIVFSNIYYLIRECASGIDEDTFYITVDAYSDSVNAKAYFYHEHGLEVVIEPGYIQLGLSSDNVNLNRIANGGYNPEVPPQPAYFDYFKLVFDTQGPVFTMGWTHELDECKTDTVDLLDSLCITADTTGSMADPGDVIKGNITLDLSPFGFSSSFPLKPTAAVPYESCFVIPDAHITNCIDVDSGYIIYATAKDSAGNSTTMPLYFEKPIDTCKPNIDSIQFFITYDQNGDGIAAIGDSLAIVAWALSNADFEVDSMIANLSAYFPGQPSKRWQKLDDVLNNNRLFRKKFMLEAEGVEMAADSAENRITVWAWDNACNYDTLQKKLNKQVDLQRPSFVDCYYYWHWDIDTFDCIGIEDSVLLGADLTGTADLASVTADLVEAGIYGADAQALFDDGTVPHGDATADDGIYNLLWEVGEPPIEDGKDVNNTVPPTADADYSVKFTATDEAGNWDTCRAVLNRTLDTRRPRWTYQSKMYIKQMPDAKLAIFWPTSDATPANSCNEKDAAFFYIYVDSGDGYGSTPFGATFDTEYKADTNMWISEILTDGKYYRFKIKQEDDCGNFSDFSKEMGAVADGTPPHVCIAVPDSGLTFGDDFLIKAVADSVSHDVDSVCLWYRFRRDIEDPLLPPGQWKRCQRDPCCCMMSPGDAWVWIDTMKCISGYTGWVEMITVACDEAGNCQDTTMGFDDACLVMDDDVFRPGHFLFYWDTLAPGIMAIEVDGFPSPQTSCGYDVWFDSLNWLVIDVPDAATGELFEVEVRALGTSTENRIFHQDNCAMPCTVWFSVDGWDEGTQTIYFYVKDYDNGITGNDYVQVCVPPPPPENCIYISWPTEWMRIPCTGTSGYNCVEITAEMYDYAFCSGVTFTEAKFQWSSTGSDPWYLIEDVIGSGPWTTCWDNSETDLEDGDTVYLRVIAHDEYYMADTSYMVKVFMDCESPQVSMLIEDVYYTCGDGVPKVPCAPLILKAVLADTLVDIDRIRFFVKRHSDPDLHVNWMPIQGWANPAWSDNIWMEYWDDPCCDEVKADACMEPGDFWDIRVAARDIAGHYMFDYDEDGFFDDSTFNDALAANAGITVFVDDEAPEPAISLVCDQGHEPPICIVNPSSLLNGSGEAYVQSGNDIYVEISPLPSEDTCTVMKVEYFLQIFGQWVHVGTSFDPNHWPITFNPVDDGLIRQDFLENGHWMSYLKAVLYDSLGNSEDDQIDLYLLDVTPTQAVIIQPLNDSYVSGDVTLRVAAIDAYEICKVCYEYSTDGENWYPVNGGYPNACVYGEQGGPPGAGGGTTYCQCFNLTWYTSGTVADGEYYLRAVATDCDNNVDENPPTIKVTVANELPTVVMDDPRVCERTCPDSPEDTLGYVSGTVTLSAEASSTVPIEYVKFWYKSVYSSPFFYKEIDRDYFPTDGKYTVEWNTSGLPDGRYFVKAEAHNIAGKWGESEPPIMVTVDNTAPLAQITAIDGSPVPPEGIDISMGDVIEIELVAIDSLSNEGWTRCYNSGLAGIEVCLVECDLEKSGDYTKCFEVSPATDGFHTVQWNVSGLELNNDNCSGCYEFFVHAWDCLGNVVESEYVTVNVYDYTAPITYVAGFDDGYIYAWSTEEVSTLQFQYADSGSGQWIPIGVSQYIGSYSCPTFGYSYMYLYYTTWDPSALDDGSYQVRVISHDVCSNQDDDMAPLTYIVMDNGTLIPYQPDPEILEPMVFIKNWCVGDMQGVVMQTVTSGSPFMLARFIDPNGSYHYECVDMDASLDNSTEFAGSFSAFDIRYGGSAEFFSSVTMQVSPPPMTGVDKVTYLSTGTFDVAKVSCNLGTHGTYQDGCVELTIPDGAAGCTGPLARYVWVGPTYMEWAPVTQPDILPIGMPIDGSNETYAMYVSFTDCDYCCGWVSSYFGDQVTPPEAGAGTADGYEEWCCLNDGKYAKIKMCYDPDVDVDETHLAVAWWDCYYGVYCFDNIYYPATVEGFDTENHTVEFATTCLMGPFVVVQLLDRECDGTIVVDMLQVNPYCNGYTNATPQFKALITDNVQGTDGIDLQSMRFKIDLYEMDQMITVFNSSFYDTCDQWAEGFGHFSHSGWDPTSGILRVGWSDSTYGVYGGDYYQTYCDGCERRYFYSNYWDWICFPAEPLEAGEHTASVTAQNQNIQTCTDIMEFTVDATAPKVRFADAKAAYVGENPHFCIYFTDTEAGMDKNSVWIDLWGDETTSPDPNNHSFIGTIAPAQQDWVDDTTVCVDGTFEYYGGYLHVYVYGGPDCLCNDCTTPQYYHYECGVADCVGNHTDVFWQYFTVDADGPSISFLSDDYCETELKFRVTDDKSGLLSVKVYEDSSEISQGLRQDEHNTEYWWYTPAVGVSRVDVEATDNLGNVTVYSFDLPTDCAGPAVKFADGYVCLNPTIEFWVTDPAGVDWTTVNAYINGCSEDCYFYAEDLEEYGYIDTETGKVTIDGCHLDCYDGAEVNVYVYSGTSYTGYGPHDLNGNYGRYRQCSFVVDGVAPTISATSLDERPIVFTIKDAKSGVDWSSFEFYEDGVLICDGYGCEDDAITIDTEAGKVTYDPESGGAEVEIRVYDMTGCNQLVKTYDIGFMASDPLVFNDPHNYPNPFDPSDGTVTYIYPGLSKTCNLTVKIYDFAGELVRELQKGKSTGTSSTIKWNGTTDNGTKVGNGTYLCYLYANCDGSTKTAVIKITVLREDE